VPDPDNYTVLLRFLGTTPTTSSITKTLLSLIRQLSRLFNLEAADEPLRNARKTSLKDHLLALLTTITAKFVDRKIVIILDSIDQLVTSDYDLDWVIDRPPPNVKFVYSVIGSHESILQTFTATVQVPDCNLLKISTLDEELSVQIVQAWLAGRHRQLSPGQWTVVRSMLARATLFPLYIKLLFDVVVKWTSFHAPEEEFTVGVRDIDSCIRYLFKVFEKEHGYLLFSRSVVYMSSFANGNDFGRVQEL